MRYAELHEQTQPIAKKTRTILYDSDSESESEDRNRREEGLQQERDELDSYRSSKL